MTENEAIKYIENHGYIDDEVKDMAIKALEEIQQYKAIGTPTQIYEKIGGLDVELGKYHSIGTIEEFKALKEKNEPKKRGIWKSGRTCCPNCERGVVTEDRFCSYCGQKLDWGDGNDGIG